MVDHKKNNKEKKNLQIKQWKERNKDRIKQNSKTYYENNRTELLIKKKEYGKRPDIAEKKSERNKIVYQRNKAVILARQSERRKQRMKIMAEVSLHYGCKNPNCLWKGCFSSYQLDFHHLDPSTKITEVAKLESSSYEKIQNEINKCVVLCKNCHAEAHHGSFVPIESMLCDIFIEQGIVQFKLNS